MALQLRLLRPLLLAAFLLLPSAAGAAPIVVTYNITGGYGFGHSCCTGSFIQSGTVVVTFPNPGSGPPPLNSAGVSIYFHFLTATPGGGFPGTLRKTFKPTQFPTGAGFRGANKTLRARRSRPFDVICTVTGTETPSSICHSEGYERFVIRATANGQISMGLFARQFTNTATQSGFAGITGQEVSSAPEPAVGPLFALAGIVAGCTAVAGSRWRRR